VLKCSSTILAIALGSACGVAAAPVLSHARGTPESEPAANHKQRPSAADASVDRPPPGEPQTRFAAARSDDELALRFGYPRGTVIRLLAWGPKGWSLHPAPREGVLALRHCDAGACRDYVALAITAKGRGEPMRLVPVPEFTPEMGRIESLEYVPVTKDVARAAGLHRDVYELRVSKIEARFVLCVWTNAGSEGYRTGYFPSPSSEAPVSCKQRSPD